MTQHESPPLLDQINAELRDRNLKPLKKLGRRDHHEWSITGIQEIFRHKFFTDIRFGFQLPGSEEEREYTVRYNANSAVSDGAIIVTMINDYFVIVRQYRLPLQAWTYEVPRGFGEKIDSAKINGKLGTIGIGDLPLGTVVRELGEEVTKAPITSVTHLGNLAENTGTHAGTPGYYLVQIEMPSSKISEVLRSRGEESLAVKLWTAEEVFHELGGNGRIQDNMSITGLTLAMRSLKMLKLR